MTTIAGAILTSGLTSTLMPDEVARGLSEKYAKKAKFTRFMESLEKVETVSNPKFTHLEQDIETPSTTLSAGATAAATSLSVTSADYITKYTQIVVIEGSTPNNHVVTAVSGTTLTITPGVATGDYTNGATVQILGRTAPENSIISDSYYLEPGSAYNYIQPFTERWEVSEIMNATRTYYTNQGEMVREQKDRMMERWYRGINRSLIWGARATGTTDSKKWWTTGGLRDWITTNATDVSGLTDSVLHEDDFVDALQETTAMGIGSDSRVLLCGAPMIKKFFEWKLADRFVANTDMSNRLGFRTNTYISDFGDVTVLYDTSMDQFDSGKTAFILDPEALSIAQLIPKKTYKDIQSNGQLGMAGGIAWHMGLKLKNEAAHGVLTNIA